MSVTVTAPIDPLLITQLIADGYTTLTLWYANTPDGTYANTAAAPAPTTLALMSSTEVYSATFTYSAGNSAQWFKVRPYNGSSYADISESSPFHGGGGTTLAVLRQKLGSEMRDIRLGTLTTGTSTSSAVCASTDIFRFASNYFNGKILNNTTRSLWSSITTSTKGASDTTFAISPSIAAQASGDAIEISTRFTPTEYRDAINWGIHASWPILVKNIVNTSILTVNQQYQYDVPQDIKNVHLVEIESQLNQTSTDQGVRGFPWTEVPHRLIPDGLRKKLEFERWFVPDLRFRITGTGPLSQLYSDSDFVEVIEPQTDLILYYAAFRLYSSLTNDAASSDVERYAELAKHYWGLADTLKAAFFQARPAKRGWSAETRGGKGQTPSQFGSFVLR